MFRRIDRLSIIGDWNERKNIMVKYFNVSFYASSLALLKCFKTDFDFRISR